MPVRPGRDSDGFARLAAACRIVVALLLCAFGARAAEPPKDQGWFAPGGKGAVPSTLDFGVRQKPPPYARIDPSDIIVERFKALPLVKPPEPEQRDVFESDRGERSNLDDKLASTRSGYRDGCHAGSVCYGSGPRLRDSFSDLFGN